MGKTASGAIWLNAEQLSPYDYWQYWRNTEDADVGRFLKLYTLLPLDEIARLEALEGADINEAQEAAGNRGDGAAAWPRGGRLRLRKPRGSTFVDGAAAAGLPTIELPRADLTAGLGVLTAFVKAGLVASNGEARRQIVGGGLRVNDVTVANDKATIDGSSLNTDGVVKLSLGKKKHVLLKPV